MIFILFVSLFNILHEYSKHSIIITPVLLFLSTNNITSTYFSSSSVFVHRHGFSKAGRFTFIKLFTLALLLPVSSFGFNKSRDKTGLPPFSQMAASSKNLTTLVPGSERPELLEAVCESGPLWTPVDVWNFPVSRWSLWRFQEVFRQQQQRTNSRLKLMVNIPRGRSRED